MIGAAGNHSSGGRVSRSFDTYKETAMNHPFNGEFDEKKPLTLKGTVKEVNWSDPHVTVQLETKENGQTKDWRVEMGSLSEMENNGWTETTMKAGDRITIEGNPAKSESNFASARTVEVAGKKLSAASECHPR
jgi:Family of unknown function (DUF6152)